MRNLFEYLIRHCGYKKSSIPKDKFSKEEMQKHILEYENSPLYKHHNRYFLVDGEYKRLDD